MRKTEIWKIILIGLLVLTTVPTALADTPVTDVPLIAAQNYAIGKVVIYKTPAGLTVECKVLPGYALKEVHVAFGAKLSDIPQTKKGNPKIGNFPYSVELDEPVDRVKVTIPYADPILPAYWAVHAVILGVDETASFTDETGWGAGLQFPGDNWATYFMLEPVLKMGPSFDQPDHVVQEGDVEHIDVLNDGWAVAHNVRVDIYVPLVGGVPAFEIGWSWPPHPMLYEPGHTYWNLGDIDPGMSKRIEFSVIDTIPGQYQLNVIITCSEGIWDYSPPINLQ